MPDVTKIIIAQRIGSVIEADQIVVMDEGKIVGIGRHTGLMESCRHTGKYMHRRMSKNQPCYCIVIIAIKDKI